MSGATELTEARAGALYQALLQNHPEPTFSLDADGRLSGCNAAFAQFVGRTADHLYGRALADLVVAEHRAAAQAAWEGTRAGAAQSWRADFDGPDGSVSIGNVTLVPAVLDGALLGAQGIARDLTVYRVIEEQLQSRVFSDPLTGLANRTQLVEAIARSCRRAHAPDRVAALFLDLDDFKRVNDALGHAAGDVLLVEVATRLRRATRGGDLVARLGGDEFAVLLADLQAPHDVQPVLARILDALQQPLEVGGRVVQPAGSVGVAHWDGTATPAELLRNADLAMYRAKQLGKGRHAVYDATMHAEARERLDLASDLRWALAQDDAADGSPAPGSIAAAFQPIVELATERVIKFEALARWTHPTRGPISPGVFVPLAEDSGLVEALGRRMLTLGCRRLRAAQDAARAAGRPVHEAPGVAVNVSGHQFMHGTVVDEVRAALAATGAEAGGLTLEITESVAMREPRTVLATLRALADLGVRVALDDFGTGYSSLAYLHRYPLSVLKIDKSFVDGLAAPESAAADLHAPALVQTIVQLARSLGLRTVAEGVETAAQRDALRALGCDYGQGYLFGRPELPAPAGALPPARP